MRFISALSIVYIQLRVDQDDQGGPGLSSTFKMIIIQLAGSKGIKHDKYSAVSQCRPSRWLQITK